MSLCLGAGGGQVPGPGVFSPESSTLLVLACRWSSTTSAATSVLSWLPSHGIPLCSPPGSPCPTWGHCPCVSPSPWREEKAPVLTQGRFFSKGGPRVLMETELPVVRQGEIKLLFITTSGGFCAALRMAVILSSVPDPLWGSSCLCSQILCAVPGFGGTGLPSRDLVPFPLWPNQPCLHLSQSCPCSLSALDPFGPQSSPCPQAWQRHPLDPASFPPADPSPSPEHCAKSPFPSLILVSQLSQQPPQ